MVSHENLSHYTENRTVFKGLIARNKISSRSCFTDRTLIQSFEAEDDRWNLWGR